MKNNKDFMKVRRKQSYNKHLSRRLTSQHGWVFLLVELYFCSPKGSPKYCRLVKILSHVYLTSAFSAATPPNNLKVTDIRKRRVTIEWENPSMVGSIQGYKVRYDKVTCCHSHVTFVLNIFTLVTNRYHSALL